MDVKQKTQTSAAQDRDGDISKWKDRKLVLSNGRVAEYKKNT